MSHLPKLLLVLLITLNLTVACADQKQQTPAKPNFDKDKVADYIRKSLNVPANWNVQVSETKDAGSIPGLVPIKIDFVGEGRTQSSDAWITSDGKTLIMGRSFDMSVDPYKQTWSKINLSDAPVKGPAEAKVTIVEYTDFQCPFCSRAHSTIQQLEKDYAGKIKIVYKSLPLPMHNWAEDAAVAGDCVSKQNNDAFWKYADFMFENQKTITKDNLREQVNKFATDNKLDEAKLKACIDNKETLSKVQADSKEAQSLNFNSTPSFVINGRSLVGAQPIDQFKQVIDSELAAK